MVVELLSVLLLLAGVETPEPESLAMVRHFSMQPGQSWAVNITAAAGTPSARLWWIEGTPAHTGFPEKLLRKAGLEDAELPDLIEARSVDLTAAECRALADLVGELEALTTSPIPADASRTSLPGFVFVLEIPDQEPVDLSGFAPRHPLVQWANQAWEELTACAGAQP